MLSYLSSRPAWRQLLVITLGLPLIVGLAVAAFAWPAARTEPRDLPVGVVGAGAPSERAVSALEAAEAGAFDLKLYGDTATAESAIRDRTIDGAIDVSGPTVTVYTASAASPSVAALLATLGGRLQVELHPGPSDSVASDQHVEIRDVVATDSDDPRGAVFASALLPLTICSVIIAAAIALALEFGPAWRMIVALSSVSAVAGYVVYLMAQGWLGVLPHQGIATWAALSVMILAMSSFTAGMISLIGSPGLALGAAVMVFIGNPFSGASSAPELLPNFAHAVGQWLPPGAGATLVRQVTYFDGGGAAAHLWILIAWVLFGWFTIVSGHRSFVGFAAKRRALREAPRISELEESHRSPRHGALVT